MPALCFTCLDIYTDLMQERKAEIEMSKEDSEEAYGNRLQDWVS